MPKAGEGSAKSSHGQRLPLDGSGLCEETRHPAGERGVAPFGEVEPERDFPFLNLGEKKGWKMRYCKKCVAPANTKPFIEFDEEGVCSGCRAVEKRVRVDWEERRKMLEELLERQKSRQRAKGNPYDCIIPVSGGKDSHFQVFTLMKEFHVTPLLVTYNHLFNSALGLRNLRNLIEKSGAHLDRVTHGSESVRRLSLMGLKTHFDYTLHYHLGIFTTPLIKSVQYDIPLIVMGEGFSELIGVEGDYNPELIRKWSQRGLDAQKLLDSGYGLEPYDVAPFMVPPEEQLAKVGTRVIYLSNYVNWDAQAQTKTMIEEWDFETAQVRERAYLVDIKTDDLSAYGGHNWCAYLKFGYGRGTDDANTLIRHGYITREEGLWMVETYDSVRPSDLDLWLDFVGISEEEFLEIAEPFRELEIWEKRDGQWVTKDSSVRSAAREGQVPVKPRFQPLRSRRKKDITDGPHYNDQEAYIWL